VGVGGWGVGVGPTPQTPKPQIPNPQSPFDILYILKNVFFFKLLKNLI